MRQKKHLALTDTPKVKNTAQPVKRGFTGMAYTARVVVIE